MKITKKAPINKVFALLFAIILLGFVLRSYNLTVWPRQGATFDEYAWTWLGLNLINNHVPESWSPHDAYIGHRKHLIFQGAQFWLVKPYLEHPPLFGLVAGAFAKANGVSDMYHVSIAKIRPLALGMGVFSILLVFFLVKELYGSNLALLSSLIYATLPTVVIGSRLVQNENFFTPMFLLSVYSIVRFLKTKHRAYFWVAVIICGLLPLAKVPWFAAAAGISLILIYKKRYRDPLILLLVSLLFFASFFVYGFYFDKQIFLDLWRLQLQRYDLTFNSVFALFTQPYLADRYTIDGWIYFGWISFFILLVKDYKKHFIIIFPLMAYFAVYVFAIPNEPGHGWYRYPFYPFLAISLALFIKEHFNKNLLLTFIFILLVGLSLFELTWARTFGFSFVVFRLFIILSGSSLLPVFTDSLKVRRYSIAINYFLLICLFSLNIWAVAVYNEQ